MVPYGLSLMYHVRWSFCGDELDILHYLIEIVQDILLQYKSSLGALRATLSIRECCPFFMRVTTFWLVKYRFDDGPIESKNISLR